tara:strand:+ start:827 stop:2503 length:1677 start_codon:yes stop_codon:yes gene_type:complete
LIKHNYGLAFDVQLNEIELELYAFRINHSPDRGGLGAYRHFRNVVDFLWPKMIWNPWLEKQIESLCENQWVCWAGCGASGKTYAASLYSMVYFLAAPLQTSIILTSTTAKMIRKRAWPVIQDLYRTCKGGYPAHMVDSKTTLQAIRGDDKHAIFAIPVLDGATSKAVANIQGIRSPRTMVIVDEATDTPEAAFEACSNLQKGTKEFKFLAIGNPHSKFDQHGRFSTPVKGWSSISIEDDEWDTERGVCVRFDGLKSPNMQAGKTKYDFLISEDQVRQAQKYDGEDSPKFWKYTRGMWSPEGVCKTVLSESLVEKYRVMFPAIFVKKSHMMAGLDPAFNGGDRCVIQLGRYGDFDNGKMGISLERNEIIEIDAKSSEPVHFQIANRVRAICEENKVKPQHLAIDATGEGGGLCDIIAKTWNPAIQRVEFGGKASERPVSPEDYRKSSDVYANKVTELWFSVRQWVINEQLRGMHHEAVIEFCSRMFDDEKRMTIIERKVDMKARTGKSPDFADAITLVVEMARRLGGYATANRLKGGLTSWDKMVRDCDSIYHDTFASV